MSSSRTIVTDFAHDHNYKVLEETELEAVIKCVRRAKQKKRDEEKWEEFLQSQSAKIPNDSARSSISSSHARSRLAGINKDVMESSRPTSEIENANLELVSHTYQLGPGLEKRLQDLLSVVNRMSSVLLSPRHQEQDEGEDVERTIKRSLEFDAMFTRNHLYEIQRMIKEVKQLSKLANTVELEGKISAVLKCVSQALQVYTKHVTIGSRVKFQHLVPIFQCISLTHKLLEKHTGQHNFPIRQDIEVSCSYLKQIILEKNATETKTMSASSRNLVRTRHKHKPSSDLTMYSRRKKNEWRKKSAYLAHAKFGSPQPNTNCKQSGLISSNLHQTNSEVTNVAAVDILASPSSSIKNLDKSLNAKAVNADTNTKEISFRKATRAVPEDDVSTMMEMIPIEDYVSKDVADRQRLEAEINEQDIYISISVCRQNVKLICLKEGDTETERLPSNGNKIEKSLNNDVKTIPSLAEKNETDLLECNKQCTKVDSSRLQFKDVRATTTVDRLILMDMIIDYQKEEMDEIVDVLYNLELS